MTRPTRAQTQERTRGHVLDVAHELFLRDGFGTTSLTRVAETAGYSKGAVYSNFATKNDLCLAVLDRVRERQIDSLLTEVGSDPDFEIRLAGFARWAGHHIGDSSWTALEVEFATANRHDPEVRARLAARRRALTDALADFLTLQAEQCGVRLATPAAHAALTVLGLGIGLGVQRAIDPDVPVAPLVDLLRHFLRPE